jgi:hypothetical protein
MADDDKKAPENPKGRDKEAEDRVKKQLTQSENVSKRQEQKQDILAKKAEVLNKITQASANASDAKDKNNKKIFENIETILDNNNVGSKVYLDQLEQLKQLETSLDAQIATAEKAVGNDDVVRSLTDLIEENKRNTQLLEADSTAQLELRSQLKSLNSSFSGLDAAGRENAQLLQQQFEISSQALKDAIESGDVQAQNLAMRQLEEIKGAAESEENRREAIKMNELANSTLGRIAHSAEKTADGIENAIGGALAGAGILAGLVGLALLFLDPEKFQEIMYAIIEQVSGVATFIGGIINGDFGQAMEGLGDSWQLLTGVALLLLPKVIRIVGAVAKAIKLFQIFMAKSFIPGMLSMFRSITSLPMKGMNLLTKVATGFRYFITGAWIPGMITSLKTMMIGLKATLAPFAAPILIITAIIAAVALIGVALAKIRDALGFTSIFDVLMLGLAHMRDAFAHVVNLVGSIVNFIVGLVEKFGKFLGFEIDLPKIPKMATDNAARKKAELEVKAREAEIANDISEVAGPAPAFNVDNIVSDMSENAAAKIQGAGDTVVTTVSKGGNTQNTTTTVTTVQTPLTHASNILSSVTSR